MSKTTRPLEALFRRILLPLDVGETDAAGLEAAIRLAERFSAEVVGIFVEDADLARLAALPGARETAFLSATTRPLTSADMARALRVRADIMRGRLQQRAVQAQVSWSFRVLQGELLAEQFGEASASDLLILKAGSGVHRGPAAATRHFFAHSSCTVWLRRARSADDRPVVALFDDTPSGLRVLAVACQFARRDGKHLMVMIPCADAEEFQRRAGRAGIALSAGGVEAEFQPLAREAAADLIQVVSAARGKLLVISRDSPLAAGAAYQRLLDDLPCEVVLAG